LGGGKEREREGGREGEGDTAILWRHNHTLITDLILGEIQGVFDQWHERGDRKPASRDRRSIMRRISNHE
jgi:hypothetical protein